MTTHDTIDEAIAVALAESRPGDIVEIHADDCEIEHDDDDEVIVPCSCEPMVLTKGAEA